MKLSVKPAGDQALILYMDDVPTEQTIGQLKALVGLIESSIGEDLIDTVASYQSVLVRFNPLTTDHADVQAKIEAVLDKWHRLPPAHSSSRIVRLPVYYDVSVGPDLERIAQYHDISIEEVIERHCMNLYSIYAIGFAPGFAYLGHVDDEIATPRLDKPRKQVAAGSVAIADHQTAIYPKDSPGGWNIIGRCPSPLFQPKAAQSLPFQVGDRVQFMPISEQEFQDLGGALNDL